MSRELFNRSPDLKRLRDEGYFVQVKGGVLIMRDVPYVDANKQIRLGTLISSLTLAGDQTRRPDTHVIHFDGDYPCRADGSRISGLSHQTDIQLDFGNGVTARHSFSSKPDQGYADYYEKMTSYAGIISGPAAVLDPEMTARVLRARDDDEDEGGDDGPFLYVESASDRVGLGALSGVFKTEVVAIIGLGGTGSYILDQVAKTPVPEIRIVDADEFLQHNAFRAPGAPTLEQLREVPMKVDYLKTIYDRMHRGIVAHPVAMTADTLHLLDGITFAFLSMDAGEEKRLVVEKLEAIGASFVDVGMGLELDDGSLGGILRVTASTPKKRDHVHTGRISFAGGGGNDIYVSNIQVADLNALNAILAVVKWKKICGFYRDLEEEHHSTYTTDGNQLTNGDLP